MLPQLVSLKRSALDFLFPQWCVGCGREGKFICDTCLKTAKQILPPLCPKCGRPQSGGVLCPQCISWQTALDGIRSPFQFDGVIRQAVHQLKYQNIRALAEPMAGLLAAYVLDNPLPVDVLVPVPLHAKRLKQRGYNQASLLTNQLARLLSLPVLDNCLIRQRPTIAQAKTASVIERRSNVVDAFTCRNNVLSGKKVLLIDDVSTSGATLDACAGALKLAGADLVWGLVFAHEI